MPKPAFFEVLTERAEFRPTGHLPLADAIQAVSDAISYATLIGVRRLLVVGHGLERLENPSTLDRFRLGQEWAKASGGGGLKVAIVLPARYIHPQKFGVLVALNRGLQSDAFDNEHEAIAWLEGRKPD